MSRRSMIAAAMVVAAGSGWALLSQESARPTLRVPKVEDFEIDGTGSAPAWEKSSWVDLVKRDGGSLPYWARFKVVWSDTGLYVLMAGSDEVLTATMDEDFLDLWKEDVFEVFLWTDERWPVYFEYEISPLGRELPILIPNFEGQFLGWRPWHYDGARRVRKKTSVIGNRHESGATVKGWTAEMFFPYELLRPLRDVPPRDGTRWRANFYRVDHDHEKRTAWDWARVGPSFHEFERFGTLEFDE